MKEDLTQVDSFTLAEKHALWDKVYRCTFLLSKSEAMEDLFACLTIFEATISSTITREKLGARLSVFYSSNALLDATRNSKVNFGDSCCNSEAQVLPSDARSYPHEALFCLIQTRDDKGVDTGG
ncbi:hypothetical protein PS1_030122 [Malus domestica]